MAKFECGSCESVFESFFELVLHVAERHDKLVEITYTDGTDDLNGVRSEEAAP